MRVIPVLMLALAMAGCGGSETAPDADQLACLGQTLTAEQRAQVARHILTAARLDHPSVAPLWSASISCAARFRWSDRRAAVASMYTMGDIGQAEIRRRLGARGIDVGPLEQAIVESGEMVPRVGELGNESQTSARLEPLEPAFEAIRRRHRLTQEDAEALARFAATRVTMETARRDFALPDP